MVIPVGQYRPVAAMLVTGSIVGPPATSFGCSRRPPACPPWPTLAQVRAEHAAVMLLHSDEPVTGIGRAVGWPDQNYFARRFKAHYGLSTRWEKAQYPHVLHSFFNRPTWGDSCGLSGAEFRGRRPA